VVFRPAGAMGLRPSGCRLSESVHSVCIPYMLCIDRRFRQLAHTILGLTKVRIKHKHSFKHSFNCSESRFKVG